MELIEPTYITFVLNVMTRAKQHEDIHKLNGIYSYSIGVLWL